MYKEIFRDSICIDALCYGEGEKPLLELVKAIDKRQFLVTNMSWITREKVEKENIGNKQLFQYDLIENLGDIPFYDYDILNINDYRSNSILSLFPLEKERKRKTMPIETSRGCIYHCC